MKVICRLFLFSIFLIFCTSCKDDNSDISQVVLFNDTSYILEFENLPPPNLPADNQLRKETVKLGRFLFYDTKLSINNSQSCASCHLQEFAFTDPSTFSIGAEGQIGKRQAMSIFNMAWNSNGFFWDGREELLRHQALEPIQDPLEMNESIENVLAKLSSDTLYVNQFKRAFENGAIDEVNLSLALEQFMFSIVSSDSKYDRYLQGTVSLTESEERGKDLFFQEFNPGFPEISGADCAHCHSGMNFSNNQYINNGLDSDSEFDDLGRALATLNDYDNAKFKTTSLRNIALTAPYMHDGRFTTLEEVLTHYNEEMKMSSTVDPALIYPIENGGLLLTDQDIDDIIAFMHTLTDESLVNDLRYSDPFN